MNIKIFKKLIPVICFSFIILIFSYSGYSQNNQNSELIKNLNIKIPELLKKAMIPGLSIAVIRNGKQIWTKGFGIRSNKTKDLIKDDTIFEAASLSKPVFAYAVMRLVEKGKLDLDRPLTEYISKEYLEKRFLGRKIDDKRIFEITARMCLSHSPGFPNWRRGGKLKIINEPGKKFSYSGEGFGFLQRVVEKITGLSLNDLMKREVFEPLEMSHSSYIWQKDFDTRTAYPHGMMGTAGPKRKLKRGHAAASLHTTASDYAKYILAIMNYKGLKEETIRSMLKSQIVLNPGESDKVYWGLGFGIERVKDITAYWHWGDNETFKCFFMAYPKQRSGVCFFTNSINGLTIRKQIVQLTIGGKHPVFDEISLLKEYADVNDPGMEFVRIFKEKGLKTAFKTLESLKKTKPLKDIINEGSINSMGYFYLGKKDYDKAVLLFKLNTEIFPGSFNAWDSLGEACMKKGDNKKAVKYYEKSVKLNPDNAGGRKALKKLKGK